MQMRSMLARRQVQISDRVRKNGKWTLQRVCFGSPVSSACGGPRGPRHAHLRFCACGLPPLASPRRLVCTERDVRVAVSRNQCSFKRAQFHRVLLASRAPVLSLTGPLNPRP